MQGRFCVRTLGLPVLALLCGACQSDGSSTSSQGGSSSGGVHSGGSSSGGVHSGGSSSGGTNASGKSGDAGGSASGGLPGLGGAGAFGGAAGAGSGGPSSGGNTQGGNTQGGGSSQAGASHGGGALGGRNANGGAGAVAGSAPTSQGCGSANQLLFCEDFEKLVPGPMPSGGVWSTSHIGPEAPAILVDATTAAHSGTRSLLVRAPAANFQSFLNYRDASVLPPAEQAFYLRSYVRLGRAMAGGHNAYLILDRNAAPGAGAAVRLGEQNEMLSLTVGGDSHGSLSNATFWQDQLLGPRFVAHEWACLEGYFNSATTEIDFWLDGVAIADFHHTDWPADAYDTVRFGFEKYAGPELEIWFDDIAIGAAPIGCR